jgi:hypothetical protein
MVTAVSDKMTETGLTGLINLAVSWAWARPLYCLRDREMEQLAEQVERVRIFKRHLPVLKIHPGDADDAGYAVITAAEVGYQAAAEVEHQATTFQAIASIPELTSALMDLFGLITSNNPDHHAQLQKLVEAIKVYSALPHLSDPQLARIHVILACWDLEDELGDDEDWGHGIPSANAIKERARELFERPIL